MTFMSFRLFFLLPPIDYYRCNRLNGRLLSRCLILIGTILIYVCRRIFPLPTLCHLSSKGFLYLFIIYLLLNLQSCEFQLWSLTSNTLSSGHKTHGILDTDNIIYGPLDIHESLAGCGVNYWARYNETKWKSYSPTCFTPYSRRSQLEMSDRTLEKV